MAPRPGLSLKQSQQLALTPGLRQSIELMQLSALDLGTLVQRKLEENPFLERDETPEEPAGGLAAEPRDLPEQEFIGESWDAAGGDEEAGGDYLAAPGPSLVEYLAGEARLAFADPAERALALALIEELDEAGYLPGDLGPLFQASGLPASRLESVLSRLQRLGPAGLFARSLSECLSLQLAERDLLDEGYRRLLEQLALVAAGDWARLGRLTGLDEAELARRLRLLRSLDPKPALSFNPPEAATAIADLVVTLDAQGRPQVRLNAEALPRLKVNLATRRALKPQLKRRDERRYVAERMEEATWLVRALARRGQTLLALGQELAVRQAPFFRDGFPALRPLTRRTLAEVLNLSEASVSRLVANKFLASPQGLLPLRRLFSAALAGGSTSAAAVAARLAALVAEEPPGRPLSDRALQERLAGEGLAVARRTVAKYRESLGIPPAFRRRRSAGPGLAGTRGRSLDRAKDPD